MIKNNAGMEELAGVYEISAGDSITVIKKIVSFISACTAVMRTDVARKWGGFFDQYKCLMGEDRHLFLKILFNERIGIVPEPHAIYHIEASDLCHGEGDGHGSIAPYLLDCAHVLDVCPTSKRHLLKELLTILALEKAKALTYSGLGGEARELLNRFSANASLNPRGFFYALLLIRVAPLLPAVRWCWHHIWQHIRKIAKLSTQKRFGSLTDFPLPHHKGRRPDKFNA
jgi:hypothetical protein